MAILFPEADPRDSKILDFIANNELPRAADFLYDETIAFLERNATYRRICKDYQQLCEEPIKHVIDQRLNFLKSVFEMDDETLLNFDGDHSFTEKTIEYAIITASAAMAKQWIDSGQSLNSPQGSLIAGFFQSRIRPRMKALAIRWCNQLKIQVDWETRRKGDCKGINGRDLVDHAVLEIWMTSLAGYSNERAFEWLQGFVVKSAGWAFWSFMIDHEEWIHPARYYLARDIRNLIEESIENPERIAEELAKRYFSIYQECCAVHSKPTLVVLRAEGIPDLSHFSDVYGCDDYLPEEEFVELLETVLSQVRITNIITQMNLIKAVSLNEMINEIPEDWSTTLLLIRARLKKIRRLLKDNHRLLTPHILKKSKSRKGFKMMWKADDQTITAHPKINWKPGNARAVRSRAIKKLKKRLEEADMEPLTRDERVAVFWLYKNVTPPYREFSRRRKNAQFAPDDWERNLESANKKLKIILKESP